MSRRNVVLHVLPWSAIMALGAWGLIKMIEPGSMAALIIKLGSLCSGPLK